MKSYLFPKSMRLTLAQSFIDVAKAVKKGRPDKTFTIKTLETIGDTLALTCKSRPSDQPSL